MAISKRQQRQEGKWKERRNSGNRIKKAQQNQEDRIDRRRDAPGIGQDKQSSTTTGSNLYGKEGSLLQFRSTQIGSKSTQHKKVLIRATNEISNMEMSVDGVSWVRCERGKGEQKLVNSIRKQSGLEELDVNQRNLSQFKTSNIS
ncbi:unnamed protein product [Sympodiomycopsis kandeliae]